MVTKVALVVAKNYDTLIRNAAAVDEAATLHDAFRELGMELCARSFRDTSVDWSEFDAVVPKAAWDYFRHPRQFTEWLDRLTADGVRTINDAELIRWSHDKAYLCDLRDAGIPVAPFAFFPAASDASAVVSRLRAEGWRRVVIKPSISGAAWKTVSGDLDHAAELEAAARDILEHSALLAQPFFDEIPSMGEWSVLFVAGEATHAVLKRPRAGDFRSQEMWGAHTEPKRPPGWLIDAAARALRAAPAAPTYGRVDGFIRDGELYVMELELIEPYFFFEHAPRGTAMRLSKAIASRLFS